MNSEINKTKHTIMKDNESKKLPCYPGNSCIDDQTKQRLLLKTKSADPEEAYLATMALEHLSLSESMSKETLKAINIKTGKLIKEVAGQRGITMYRVSKITGMSQSELSRICGGTVNIKLNVLEDIVNALGCTFKITIFKV